MPGPCTTSASVLCAFRCHPAKLVHVFAACSCLQYSGPRGSVIRSVIRFLAKREHFFITRFRKSLLLKNLRFRFCVRDAEVASSNLVAPTCKALNSKDLRQAKLVHYGPERRGLLSGPLFCGFGCSQDRLPEALAWPVGRIDSVGGFPCAALPSRVKRDERILPATAALTVEHLQDGYFWPAMICCGGATGVLLASVIRGDLAPPSCNRLSCGSVQPVSCQPPEL
jgi:hypothetical protein